MNGLGKVTGSRQMKAASNRGIRSLWPTSNGGRPKTDYDGDVDKNTLRTDSGKHFFKNTNSSKQCEEKNYV